MEKMIKSINRVVENKGTEKDYKRVTKLVIGLIIYVVIFGIIL